MEQSPWMFYAMGYSGIVLYILLGALELGKKVDALMKYMKDNSLAILATVVAYNAVAMVWMFSDFFSGFGLKMGELNGLIVFVAYGSLSLVIKGARKFSKKAEEVLEKVVDSNGVTP
jgi:hypothetical protein